MIAYKHMKGRIVVRETRIMRRKTSLPKDKIRKRYEENVIELVNVGEQICGYILWMG